MTPELVAELARLIITQTPIPYFSSVDVDVDVPFQPSNLLVTHVVNDTVFTQFTHYTANTSRLGHPIPWHPEASGVISDSRFWLVILDQRFYYADADELVRLTNKSNVVP